MRQKILLSAPRMLQWTLSPNASMVANVLFPTCLVLFSYNNAAQISSNRKGQLFLAFLIVGTVYFIAALQIKCDIQNREAFGPNHFRGDNTA